MGRPINKRYFSSTAGSANLIEITGDVGSGITTGFIVRQKSTREFIVNLGGNIGRVRLVNNVTPGVGEAYIRLFEDGSDADGSGADFTADMGLTTVAVTAGGSDHSVADTLTIVDGGGSSTSAATLNIDSVIPANGQDEGDYDGVLRNGTFVAGTGYTDGTPSIDVITLSDGTVLTSINVVANAVTAFTIDSTTATIGQVADDVTLSSTGAGNNDFTLTLGDANQQLHTLSNPAASVSILAAGDYQGLPASPATVTSNGPGSMVGTTITLTDWALVSGTDGSTLVQGGTLYDQAPTVTVSGGGGTGATATASVAGNAVANVNVTGQGTGFTSIPLFGFTNAGAKFVERFKAHKVNAADGVQTVWDNTLGATPPTGLSKIDNDA